VGTAAARIRHGGAGARVHHIDRPPKQRGVIPIRGRHLTLTSIYLTLTFILLVLISLLDVDFKTGKPSEKHRRQLLCYAHLWWRTTGDAPVRISAQYLDGVELWTVTLGALADVEAELEMKIPLLADTLRTRPAAAKPGTR